ncbi:hypothetical protein PIB30_053439 [Stylosanthes scabra]|uniref:Dirigent protein n=1 Tax=Stylosanthes scabra TaxID=79078 RepID=A0ABU6RIV3_9FABA|nr:hypothetical protein [Stylosanthes scabra]
MMTIQKNLTFFLFLVFSSYTTFTSATTFGTPIDPKSIGINQKEQTLSHFRFYWQDIVGGSNATAINVVQPLAKWAQTTLFGEIRVLDNPLTSEPSLSSKVLGRVQGIYVGESQTEPVLFMAGTLVFHEGRYNGSTIHIIARNVVLNKVRENTIVGGTGVFRFAKGYAEARTVTYNSKTGDSTVQYDVYVYHN